MERRHDIDWLRVIAIGLLLIYHIAIIFQPWAMYIGFIRSEAPLQELWVPMTLLNVWRIPFLFFVSGMGVYFAMTGFGNKLAGLLGEASESLGEFTIFTGIAGFCVVFGLLVMLFRKKLEALTHGAEDNEREMKYEEAEGFELADNQ